MTAFAVAARANFSAPSIARFRVAKENGIEMRRRRFVTASASKRSE